MTVWVTMPSSWDVYYVVFLSAFLALAVPALLALVSRAVRSGKRSPVETPSPIEHAEAPRNHLGRRINARFFLGVNAALVLITLGLALIPCVGILQNPETVGGAGRTLVAIITLAGFAGMGLFYSATKGDLSWISSYRDAPEEKHE